MIIEATATQRHVDDSGPGEKQPFASMWLPVGRTVGRGGMGAKEMLGWDGTGCSTSVGGCGSGLVLNGQECWRGTGVVWVWVWVCVCVCVCVCGRRSRVKVGRRCVCGSGGSSPLEVAWGGTEGTVVEANKKLMAIAHLREKKSEA